MKIGAFPLDVIILVGTGGTGSHLAPQIVRIAYIQETLIGWAPIVIFIDKDALEIRNVNRQNFYPTEIGLNKAVALAQRLEEQFGIHIIPIDKNLGRRAQYGYGNTSFDDHTTVDLISTTTGYAPGSTRIMPSEGATWLQMIQPYLLNTRNVLLVSTTDSNPTRHWIATTFFNTEPEHTRLFTVDYDPEPIPGAQFTQLLLDSLRGKSVLDNPMEPMYHAVFKALTELEKLKKETNTADKEKEVISQLKLLFQLQANETPFSRPLAIDDLIDKVMQVSKSKGYKCMPTTLNAFIKAAENKHHVNLYWIDAGNAKTNGQVVLTASDIINPLIYANLILPMFNNNILDYYSATRTDLADPTLLAKMLDYQINNPGAVDKFFRNLYKQIKELKKREYKDRTLLPHVVDAFPESFEDMTTPIVQTEQVDVIEPEVGACTLNAIEEPQILPINVSMAASVTQMMFQLAFGTIDYQSELIDISGTWKKIPIGESVSFTPLSLEQQLMQMAGE